MIYLSIKTFHIVAVILWLGSLILITQITSSRRLDTDQMRIATRTTDTFIGVSWLTGIVLVLMGNWYLSTWWLIKIFIVVLVSAIHTVVHRRWKSSADDRVRTPKFVPIVLFCLTIAVVGLAVFKQPV